MSVATPPSPPAAPLLGDEQRREIDKVCRRCAEFLAPSLECRLVRRAGEWFRQVFDNKRCQIHLFIERFVQKRLSTKLGGNGRDHVADVVSEVVLALIESPPRGLPSCDLVSLRRVIAGRAQFVIVDYLRKLYGRTRCGNCTHHVLRSDRTRLCMHPNPAHPWTGREVPAAEDPRKFEPPCDRYSSRRERVATGGGEDDEDPVVQAPAVQEHADDALFQGERARLLLACMAAVQRRDARAHLVLMLTYFKQKTNEEIARAIDMTVRSVTRYKERGMELLRSELDARGVQLQDVM